jgi:hypothetical protein
MRVSADQMRKWVELLHESHAILKEHCRGPSWTQFYGRARPAAVAGLQGNGPPQSRARDWINKRSIHHPE